MCGPLFSAYVRVKNKGKVVGTVGARLSGGSISLISQGIARFPHMLMPSGYKVGTMGTKGRILMLFQPVPYDLAVWWVHTNPVMVRVSGVCSPYSHCSHHFLHIYVVNSESR